MCWCKSLLIFVVLVTFDCCACGRCFLELAVDCSLIRITYLFIYLRTYLLTVPRHVACLYFGVQGCRKSMVNWFNSNLALIVGVVFFVVLVQVSEPYSLSSIVSAL